MITTSYLPGVFASTITIPTCALDGTAKGWQVVGNILLLVGWVRETLNKRMRKCSRRGVRCNVLRKVAGDQSLDSPVAKNALNMYLGNMNEYQLDHWVVPEVGYFERVTGPRVLYPGIFRWDSVAQASSRPHRRDTGHALCPAAAPLTGGGDIRSRRPSGSR